MREAYLVLDLLDQASHRVRVLPTLADAVKSWSPSTRLSPIYLASSVEPQLDADQAPVHFEGDHLLAFLGPLDPSGPIDEFSDSVDLWLTMGAFNVILHSRVLGHHKKIKDWATAKEVAFELWRVRDGAVIEMQYSPARQSDPIWRSHVAEVATTPVLAELEELVKEYCPLMASALSRSEQVLPEVVPDLIQLNQFVRATLPRKGVSHPLMHSYEGLKMLTTVNAGLSRFSSQAFSGTTPICETECHFWTHSLLGTAVANVALWRFCAFVFNVLGRADIPYRIGLLRHRQPPTQPAIELILHDDEFWYEDHLAAIEIPEDRGAKSRLPPITCFSGRDGFKSTLYTMSAPLAIIGACNSLRWTLLTLTHEISHNVVRAVLGTLYPYPEDQELEAACNLLTREPRTLLESLQRYLIVSVLAMQQVDEGSQLVPRDKDHLRVYLDRWHHEVEELMVHVFDFLYFYEGNYDKYIRGIWLSWSVIPNIGNRVPEYVLRTLCAVLALNLRRGTEIESATRDQVREVLGSLTRSSEGGQYIAQAISYLEGNWESLRKALIPRRGLIRIVRTFLYSDALAVGLRADRQAGGGGHQGYPFKSLDFHPGPIENPLRFVDGFTTSAPPSVIQSMWMLQMLAFNVGRSSGEN